MPSDRNVIFGGCYVGVFLISLVITKVNMRLNKFGRVAKKQES